MKPCLFKHAVAGVMLVSMACGANAEPPSSQNAPAERSSKVVWMTDYAKALNTARRERKLLLLDFTGSDWCIWCHRLDGEILEQKPFLDYARDKLVLVQLDFPRKKPQAPELVRQNAALSDRFGVTGYPTIIVVDDRGREVGRTGYMEGGPKTFVRELKRIAERAADQASP